MAIDVKRLACKIVFDYSSKEKVPIVKIPESFFMTLYAERPNMVRRPFFISGHDFPEYSIDWNTFVDLRHELAASRFTVRELELVPRLTSNDSSKVSFCLIPCIGAIYAWREYTTKLEELKDKQAQEMKNERNVATAVSTLLAGGIFLAIGMALAFSKRRPE